MLVDLFEDGGVLEGNYFLWLYILEHPVALDLLVLVEPQPVEPSQVGCHQLFSYCWTADFRQVFLEELDLDRFLNLGQDGGDILLEGVDGLVLFAVKGEGEGVAG